MAASQRRSIIQQLFRQQRKEYAELQPVGLVMFFAMMQGRSHFPETVNAMPFSSTPGDRARGGRRASNDRAWAVFDIPTGQGRLVTPPERSHYSDSIGALSADGRLFANTCGRRNDEQTTQVRDLETGKQRTELRPGFAPDGLRLSRDGSHLATIAVGDSGHIRIWNSSNGRILHDFSGLAIQDFEFHPTRPWLLWTDAKQLHVLDLQSGVKLLELDCTYDNRR